MQGYLAHVCVLYWTCKGEVICNEACLSVNMSVTLSLSHSCNSRAALWIFLIFCTKLKNDSQLQVESRFDKEVIIVVGTEISVSTLKVYLDFWYEGVEG